MTLSEAGRQFFLVFRAAPWFASVAVDEADPRIRCYLRSGMRLNEPLHSLARFEGWPVQWIDEPTPVPGDDWVDPKPTGEQAVQYNLLNSLNR